MNQRWTKERIDTLAKVIVAYFSACAECKPTEKKAPKLPLISDCARPYKITAQKITKLSQDHEGLKHALDKAKDIQEAMLVQYALAGLYNTAFSIFAAKNLLSWRDSREESVQNHQIVQVLLPAQGSNANNPVATASWPTNRIPPNLGV